MDCSFFHFQSKNRRLIAPLTAHDAHSSPPLAQRPVSSVELRTSNPFSPHRTLPLCRRRRASFATLMSSHLMSLKRGHDGVSTDGVCAVRFTTDLLDDQSHHLTSMELEKPSADNVQSYSGRRRVSTPDEDDSDIGCCQATRLRRKAKLVQSACAQCQKKKTKCSGKRPVCHSCNDRGLECSWDVGEGLTRITDLKLKLNKATRSLQDLDTLLDTMRHGTDNVSCMLLAKLRLGVSLEDLVAGIRLETSATDTRDSDAPDEATFSQPPLSLPRF